MEVTELQFFQILGVILFMTGMIALIIIMVITGDKHPWEPPSPSEKYLSPVIFICIPVGLIMMFFC